MTTSCWAIGASGCAAFHAAAMCASNSAEASTGEIFATSGRRAPRQNGRGTIHARMAQPTFRRGHQSPGHARPLPAGESARDQLGRFAPRQLGGAGRQFMVAGNIEARRQQRQRRNLAGPLQLRNGKVNHRRVRALRRVHKSDGAIRRAKINADDVGEVKAFGSLMRADGVFWLAVGVGTPRIAVGFDATPSSAHSIQASICPGRLFPDSAIRACRFP